MKIMICVCLVAMVAAVALARPDDKYTDKYDNVNLDEILANKRLLNPYILCILEETNKCAPDAKELKSHIKEALENGCAKCSEKHIAGVKKVILYLIEHENEEWKKLSAKYDADNKYSTKYENELKELRKSKQS